MKKLLSVLAGLVTGLTLFGLAEANEFSITLNPNQSLSNVLIITGWASGNMITGGPPDATFTFPEYRFSQEYIGAVSSGTSTHSFSYGENATFFTVLGIYNGSDGVTVAMKNVPSGKLWDQYFNQTGIQTPRTESEIANYLRSYASGPLTFDVINFVCAHFTTFTDFIGGSISNTSIGAPTGGVGGTVVEPLHLVNFSGASDGGSVSMIQTASSSPVPEPATMLLFGTGIAGLAAVGRRKRD